MMLICISLMTKVFSSAHHLYFIFGELSSQDLNPFFNPVAYLFIFFEFVRVPAILWNTRPLSDKLANIFSHCMDGLS